MNHHLTFTNFPPESPLYQEYQQVQEQFAAQPSMVQRFLESQGRALADAMRSHPNRVSFNLPDRMLVNGAVVPIPPQAREYRVGGFLPSLRGMDLRVLLRNRLTELEEDTLAPAVEQAARLLRYTTATYMVHQMLPSGRSVTYIADEDEEIPAYPTDENTEPESAITQASDAIVEEGSSEEKRGELQTPFVPYARRFYLPQWVSFDADGKLLAKSVAEAEGHNASMQAFLGVLHSAVALAPYMVADPEYQQKRYGMLGQLVNQGRALALYQTMDMIITIQRRAAASDLNRGLSLSLPYFDDQDLLMRTYFFEVVPAGRIMFVPAFVVRAAHQEYAKVAQDTRLSYSTRKYILEELALLERAFFKE